MNNLVPETVIDYEEIFRRGGKNLGDEDFAFFKCPFCQYVYLLDYEVDTVYLDGKDLSRRKDISSGDQFIVCLKCGKNMPNPPNRFSVTWDDLAASDWAWAAKG